MPGISGWNFLLYGANGGGGITSLEVDPLAKTYAQRLLQMRVDRAEVEGGVARKL